MTPGQYNAAVSLFFVSYSLFEPVTNVLLKRYRPKWFLSITMTLWGIVMVTMGLCHNFQGMMAARWFLGMAEAGMCVLHLCLRALREAQKPEAPETYYDLLTNTLPNRPLSRHQLLPFLLVQA